ncbi:hypothetical protein M9H77_30826 [Catharanthus roseus]|uniref:Uncharacterized protein n=1 Tax=Catharanthus roseus TaxID=4058 RepID=A0ACC0A0E3_CATRO|nr:hypothetical protein M9H77_30826 [Catharanthus roseus]
MPGGSNWYFGLKKNRGLVYVTGLITSVTFLNNGIRARRRFDLSGIWCLLHSSIEADVIRNLQSFNDVKSAIKYDRDNLTLSYVKNVLKSKDLDLRKENKTNRENIFVRGRVDQREPSSDHSKSKGGLNLEKRIE